MAVRPSFATPPPFLRIRIVTPIPSTVTPTHNYHAKHFNERHHHHKPSSPCPALLSLGTYTKPILCKPAPAGGGRMQEHGVHIRHRPHTPGHHHHLCHLHTFLPTPHRNRRCVPPSPGISPPGSASRSAQIANKLISSLRNLPIYSNYRRIEIVWLVGGRV